MAELLARKFIAAAVAFGSPVVMQLIAKYPGGFDSGGGEMFQLQFISRRWLSKNRRESSQMIHVVDLLNARLYPVCHEK